MLFKFSWIKKGILGSKRTPIVNSRKRKHVRPLLEELERRDAPSANTWTQLLPTGGPPTSAYSYEAVGDQPHDKMILFGGITSGYGMVNDPVWILDNADGQGGTPNWHALTVSGSSPSTRSFGVEAYNPSSNRMILFSGDTNFGGYPLAVNELWVLTNADGLGGTPQWTNITPSSGPTPGGRYGAETAYDSAHNRLILFGGDGPGGAGNNDVWVLFNADGSTGTPTWTQLSPTGPLPPQRSHGIGAYDPTTNSFIMAGGTNGPVLPSFDVWVLSNANGLGGTPVWTQLSTTGSPPPGSYSSSGVFDPKNNSLVVVAGLGANGLQNQTWMLSNASNPSSSVPHVWTLVNTVGGPPAPRAFIQPIYNSATDSITVFGGEGPDPNTVYNDAWVESSVSTSPWSIGNPMVSAHSGAVGEVINGQFYVVGGGPSGGGSTGAMEAYNPTTSSWTAEAPDPISRSNAGGDLINGKLYVVGGWLGSDSNSSTNQFDRYDPTTNTWASLAPASIARGSTAVAAIGNNLYVVGGRTGVLVDIPTLEIYNTLTNTWSTGAPIPTAREGAGAAVVNGKMYVIGGYDRNAGSDVGTVSIYDPVANSWTIGASVPIALEGAAVTQMNGKLYVTGGQSGGTVINGVEIYDPANDSWSTLPNMQVATWVPVAGAINGYLYVAGGNTGSQSLNTLQIYSPPIITTLSQNLATEGDAPFTLTINGANFDNNAVVLWNGTALATTWVNNGRLTATVPAANLAEEGSCNVAVLNPNSGVASNAAAFTVADAALTATATPVTTAVEGAVFSGEVATFTDANPGATLSDFPLTNVNINWGDGTITNATSITQPDGPGTAFHVFGSHPYTDEGTYSASVQITDVGGSTVDTRIGVNSAGLVVTAPTQTAGAWYPDRFPPNGFVGGQTAFGTTGVIQETISAADADGIRPNGFNSAFYDVQGRKFDLPAGTTYVTMNLYVPSSFGSLNQQDTFDSSRPDRNGSVASLWGTAVDSLNTIIAYPSIAFNNLGTNSPVNPVAAAGFQVFDYNNGYTNVPGFTGYDKWYQLSYAVVGGQFLYFVNGSLVYTDASAGLASAVSVSNAMLQAYNGGTSTAVTYTINWNPANLVTVADAALTGSSNATATGGVEGVTAATLANATFTDANTGAPYSDFTVTAASWGDGSTSTAGLTVSGSGGSYTVNGSHLYTEEGTYNFSFTVTDNGGQTATITGSTTVADADLTGSSSASATGGVEGVTAASLSNATFTDANIGAPYTDFTVTAANWGDSSTSTAGLTVSGSGGSYTVNGSHLYLEEGTYSFSITVTDDGGKTATITGSTTVADADLTGSSSATATGGIEGTTAATLANATFTDANTGAPYTDFTVTAANWGDSSTSTAGLTISGSGGSYAINGSHLYAEDGTHNFSFTVTDDGGKTATITGSTTVDDADLTGSSNATATGGVEGVTAATLSNATFTDANTGAPYTDFTVTAANWGDGSTSTAGLTISGSGGSYAINGSHLYAEDGTHSFSFTVTDDGGKTATITGSTAVGDAPLTGSSVVVNPTGLSFSGLVATFTDANPNAPLSDFPLTNVTINWGDSQTSNATQITQPGGIGTTFQVYGSHTYAAAGIYAISVTINDVGTATTTVIDNNVNFPFSDDFTGTGGLNNNWTVRVGGFQQNLGHASGTQGLNVATVNVFNAPNSIVQADVNLTGANQYAGLVSRYGGAGDTNMFWAGLSNVSGQVWAQIWVNLGGTWGLWTNQMVGKSSGTLRLETAGSSLKLFLDNNLVGYANDTRLTGGTVGMRSSVGATLAHFSASVLLLNNNTLLFNDTFTTATDKQLSNSWFNQDGNFQVANGVATGSVNDLVQPYSSLDVATVNGVNAANVFVQADVTVAAGQTGGLVARYGGPLGNMDWAGLANNNGTVQAQIWQNFNGTWTELFAQNVSSGTGTLRFEAVGSSLKLFDNNDLVAYANDTFLSGGTVGMRSTAGVTFDNFTADVMTLNNPGLSFNDTFSTAINKQLSNSWLNQVGNIQVAGGVATGLGSVNVATVNGVQVLNSTVQALVTVPAGQFAGLVSRYALPGSGDAKMYWAGLVGSLSPLAELWVNANGTWQLLSYAVVSSNTATLRLVTSANTLKLYVNNVLTLDVTDNSIGTAGSVGIRTSAGANIDDFSAN